MAERVSFDERYRYRLNELEAILGENRLQPIHAIRCMHQALKEYEDDIERRLAALEKSRG